LFKNILIATDGSDLAAKAVEQGILFAKEIGAKITAVTVTEPFPSHLLAAEPNQFGDAPIEYKKHAEAHAEKVLDTVSAAAKSTGVICETLHVEHAQVYQAIIDAAEKVRFDRNGLARASRCVGGCPRQRDGQSSHAFEDSRTRVSLREFLCSAGQSRPPLLSSTVSNEWSRRVMDRVRP
jgi:nucleotide-binding universal stress UspA family protein